MARDCQTVRSCRFDRDIYREHAPKCPVAVDIVRLVAVKPGRFVEDTTAAEPCHAI
jgi:hypothetical protein